MLVSDTAYHCVFLKAAREGWPVVSPLVRPIVRIEIAQRERFMHDNLDAIAHKVGEMQAKPLRVNAMGERLQGVAGVKLEKLRPTTPPTPPAPASPGAQRALSPAVAAQHGHPASGRQWPARAD